MIKYLSLLIIICSAFPLCPEDIIVISDTPGDDYGMGRVTYPEDPMYNPGIFDIVEFRVVQEEDNYLFTIAVAGKIEFIDHREFQYSYHLADDFILPLIHIYLDQDGIPGSGFTSLVPGVNAILAPENAWERLVIVASMPERYKAELQRVQPEIAYYTHIPDKINISKNKKEISVAIPVKILGEGATDWGYSVLMMSQEFSQTIMKNVYIREVKSTASLHNFGGGEGGLFKKIDSNIIDLIVPANKDQRQILSSYNEDSQQLATIYAVYPDSRQQGVIAQVGEVKQITPEKIVISLGSDQGVYEESRLLIDNRIVVIARDVFPELTIAVFLEPDDWQTVEIGMMATILK